MKNLPNQKQKRSTSQQKKQSLTKQQEEIEVATQPNGANIAATAESVTATVAAIGVIGDEDFKQGEGLSSQPPLLAEPAYMYGGEYRSSNRSSMQP